MSTWTDLQPKEGGLSYAWADANVTWADATKEWDGQVVTLWVDETKH